MLYLESASVTATSISPATTATHLWCTLGQTITGITLTDITYYVNQAAFTTAPHANFNSGCTD